MAQTGGDRISAHCPTVGTHSRMWCLTNEHVKGWRAWETMERLRVIVLSPRTRTFRDPPKSSSLRLTVPALRDPNLLDRNTFGRQFRHRKGPGTQVGGNFAGCYEPHDFRPFGGTCLAQEKERKELVCERENLSWMGALSKEVLSWDWQHDGAATACVVQQHGAVPRQRAGE